MGKKWRIYLIACLISGLISALCYLDYHFKWGVLGSINLTVEDYFFQKPDSLEDNTIIILGIDEYALSNLGPLPWERSVYADAIALLNQDPENAPAVIGVDVLFEGYKDEATDMYLADVVGEQDNVVLGEMATFTSDIETNEDGTFLVNDYVVDSYAEPFEELHRVAACGFTNNMIGEDGIVRNSILHLQLSDGELKDSFSYQIYKKYARKMGIEESLDQEIAMNERYQWYLPFKTVPNGYEEISIYSLLNGEVDASQFKDCIVMIGAYADGLQDSFLTAIDHAIKMNGVEIHANAVQAMLDKNFKEYGNSTIQFILLFLSLGLCIVVFHKLRIGYSLLVYIGSLVAYVGIILGFYERDILLHVIYYPLFITLIFVGEVGVNYIIAAREKRKTVHIFKRYVAPQVVDEIFKEGTTALELGGKMTDIACLFVDIRGFTPMSEVLTPPQVVDVLNTYLTLTNDCIMKNEGTLDKFIGDATMAIYNAPLPLEDYIYKAVKTAWDMTLGAEALGRKLKEKYGRDVSFGIGVHCGKAVVGNIGTKMRMDYTAIGDTVNTAARLEANAKAGEILISKDVYEALKGRISVTSYGQSIKLKGKSEGFEIFRVDDLLEEKK